MINILSICHKVCPTLSALGWLISMFYLSLHPKFFLHIFTYSCSDFSCPEIFEVNLQELSCDSGIRGLVDEDVPLPLPSQGLLNVKPWRVQTSHSRFRGWADPGRMQTALGTDGALSCPLPLVVIRDGPFLSVPA